VTARQLKTYIAMLADVLNGGDQAPAERTAIITRLKAFAESVDRLLRDERMTDTESLEVVESTGVDDENAGESDDDGFCDFEVERAR
jgi:hypothetical protein